MSFKQKVTRGALWSIIETWGQQAISFIVFFSLARLLGPESLGLISLAGAFVAFARIFINQGFSQAIVQRHNLKSAHLDTAFWINLAISVLVVFFLTLLSSPIAIGFKEPLLAPILRWLSLGIIIDALSSIQQAVLQREFAFDALAKRSLVGILVGGIVGLSMALLGFGVWSIVVHMLITSLVKVIILWKLSNWRPGFQVNLEAFREIFSFGINIICISLLNFVTRHADDFLIGYFLGPIALGYYSVAYRLLLSVTKVLIGVFHKIALPVFSRLQDQPIKLREVLYSAVELTNLVAFPIFIGIILLAPELVMVIFGEQWLPSVPAMQVLNFLGILYGGFYYNSPLMIALGKPSWSLALKFLQAIGNVVGFMIAVHWGITAVASAYVIRSYIMAPLTVWVIKKLIKIKVLTYLEKYMTPLLASLLMSFSVLFCKHCIPTSNLYISLIFYGLVGIFTYAASIFFISPRLYKEASRFLSYVG
ncbi:MAG: lipopolysaccharide biosynthesis protein [Cyanobacteria bacterium P01_D01_bin.14]